jgi:hypothetical protein
MCGQGGKLSKLNYMDINKMLDRQQASNKKGTLTNGEIKSLVKDWHNRRSEEELNHVSVKMEMKAMEKKIIIIQCGATRKYTIGKGRWHNEGVGQSNGGLCKHGDARNQNSSN